MYIFFNCIKYFYHLFLLKKNIEDEDAWKNTFNFYEKYIFSASVHMSGIFPAMFKVFDDS